MVRTALRCNPGTDRKIDFACVPDTAPAHSTEENCKIYRPDHLEMVRQTSSEKEFRVVGGNVRVAIRVLAVRVDVLAPLRHPFFETRFLGRSTFF